MLCGSLYEKLKLGFVTSLLNANMCSLGFLLTPSLLP